MDWNFPTLLVAFPHSALTSSQYIGSSFLAMVKYWEQINNYADNNADWKRDTALGNGGPDNQGMAFAPGRATEDPVAAPNVL